MTTVVDANTIILIIALILGLLTAWWIFKNRKRSIESGKAAPETRKEVSSGPEPAARSNLEGTGEGKSFFDHGAAAAGDVAGQVLGVPVHAELPGAEGPPDDLQMLKGVGPKLAQKLNENSIIRFDQLARLSANEVAMLEDRLGPFKGRITRDRIVEQASYLARGDREGFEARFGSLGSGTSAPPFSS